MKSTLFIKLILTLLSISVFASLKADDEKDINALCSLLECYNTTQKGYYELVEHVKTDDSNSTLIFINHGLFMSPVLNDNILLKWKDGKIQSAIFQKEPNEFDIVIQRVGGDIKTVDIKRTTFGKHTLEYNDKGQLVKVVEPSKEENIKYYEITYNNEGKITHIIHGGINTKKNKTYTITDKTFDYEVNGALIKRIAYNYPKALKFKQEVINNDEATFQSTPKDGKYTADIKFANGRWQTEATYNKQNQRIKFVETLTKDKATTKTTTYEYADSLLIKETLFIYVDNKFDQHHILTRLKLDGTSGRYVPLTAEDVFLTGYDENGELILERKQGYSRYKENGVWGPWIHMIY